MRGKENGQPPAPHEKRPHPDPLPEGGGRCYRVPFNRNCFVKCRTRSSSTRTWSPYWGNLSWAMMPRPSDAGHRGPLGDAPLGLVHQGGADVPAAVLLQDVEVDDLRGAVVSERRVGRVPEDGEVAGEVAVVLGEQDDAGASSAVVQITLIQREGLARGAFFSEGAGDDGAVIFHHFADMDLRDGIR